MRNDFNSNYLAHHGILGQKWGIRRFQDKDGSLTQEGIERYRRDKVLNNIGRAVTNTALGQRLAVNLNKGYRADKKEIKGLYKSKKEEYKSKLNPTNKEKTKEKLKSLKDDYKKTLAEARITAADVNYSWQKGDTNKKIQTQSIGKGYIKSVLMGGWGAKTYDQVYAETGQKGTAAILGVLGGAADYITYGGAGMGEYAYNKYKVGKEEKERQSKKSSNNSGKSTSNKSSSSSSISSKVANARKTGKYDMEFLEKGLDVDQRTGKELSGKELDLAYEKYLRNKKS